MSPRELTTTGRQACLNPAFTSYEPGARPGAAGPGAGYHEATRSSRSWLAIIGQAGTQPRMHAGRQAHKKQMRTWVGHAWHRVLVIH
jgi:hypothetical protein